jgi:hypothetical protein
MPVNDQLTIRRATREDTPTIAKTISFAEHTGRELYTYESMFNLSFDEFITRFSELLKTDEPGHGLTWKSFWIGEINGEPAGCLALYLEGENGSSSLVMTGLLMQHFTRKEVTEAYQLLGKYKSIQLPKTPGMYQFDSGAVFGDHKGKGVFQAIFNHAYNELMLEHTAPVEAQVWIANDTAIRTHTKLGFVEQYKKFYEDTDMGRMLMIKSPTP